MQSSGGEPSRKRSGPEDGDNKLSSFQEIVDRIHLYSDLNKRARTKGPLFLSRTLTYSQKPERSKGKGWLTVEVQLWFTPHITKAPQSDKSRHQDEFCFVAVLCKKRNSPQDPDTESGGGKEPVDLTGLTKSARNLLETDSWEGLLAMEVTMLHPTSEDQADAFRGFLHLRSGIDRSDVEIVVFRIGHQMGQAGRLHLESKLDLRFQGTKVAFGIINMQACDCGAMPLSGKSLQNVPICKGALKTWHVMSERFGHVSQNMAFRIDPNKGAEGEKVGICTMSCKFDCSKPCIKQQHMAIRADKPVLFRFIFDNDQRYYTQACKSPQCPFCNMECNSLLGLQQHMEACHDSFVYHFPQDHPDVVPAVNVRCRPLDDFDDSEFFGQRGAFEETSSSKPFYFHCPRRWLIAREEQYRMDYKSRKQLPVFLTHVAKTICKAPPVEVLPGFKPKARAKAKPRQARQWHESAPPKAMLKGCMFFHAKTHLPMTKTEVEMILKDPKSIPDSDDEEDLDAWKDKQKRTIRMKTDVTGQEREFMYNWNVFLKEKPILADLQMPERCRQFCEKMAYKFKQDDALRKCLTAHLLMLWELALLSPSQLDDCLQILRAQPAPKKDVKPPEEIVILD